MNKRSRVFRKMLLEESEMIVRPTVFDALSAILAERAGFRLVGTSGYGIAATLIGQPDIGLVSFGEMLERVRTIINAVSIPVDVDIDTGYGNPLNVYWTVYNFAKIGAAGVRIEDQVWPKRCGHMMGKQLISIDEMIQKIKAAIKARDEIDPDIVIGARTDALSVAGLEEAIKRGIAYAKAGADYVWVETPDSLETVELLVKKIPAPIAFNIIPGGRTPPFRIEDLERVGVKYLSIALVELYAAAKAILEVYRILKETRDLDRISKMIISWSEFNEIIGLNRWRKLELELLSREELLSRYGTTDLEQILKKELNETEAKWREQVLKKDKSDN